ncbi:MAG: T9SS C-terminal target domain-containing protein, partial [Bacteroidetes bacterium]
DITVTEDGQMVNVELEKIPAPEIEINLTSIEVDVNSGNVFSTMLNIANPGDAELEFALFAYPADGADKAVVNQNATAHYEGFANKDQNFAAGTAGYSDESDNVTKESDANRYDEFVEIHHDDTSATMNGIGAGASSWITAVRFDAEDMSPYSGLYEISQLRFHLGTNTFTHVEVKIWEGGNDDGPQTEIYSQVVTGSVTASSWNIHELPENISIQPGMEYWFGYAITSTGQFPSSTDAGPMVAGKGAWIYFNGTWALLPDLNAVLDYNWRIRGGLQIAEQVDWLAMNPQSGIVVPETDVDIQLTFDAANLEQGQYFASLVVQNNAGPSITIPVTLNVLPAQYDVTFEIKDPAGVAIDNAVVTLGSVTNAEGDYFFEDVLTGEYVYSVAAEGFSPAGGIVGINQDMTVEVMLIPEDADVITLTVTIEDEFEVPQQDVMFTLQGFGGHYTNAAGQVVLTLVPGTFAYQATKTGFEPVASSVIITDDENQILDIVMDYLRFNVEVAAVPEEGGIVVGAGEYYYGQTVGLDALANTGYHFIQWNENGTMVSDDPEFSFDVFSDRSFEAIFFINVYTITATAGANGNINPSGEIDVEHGEDITFAITPNTGFAIADVTVNGESVGAVATYTFENVTEDAVIHAEFVVRTYEVNVTSTGNGTITPSGTLTVDHGGSVEFTLTPDEGHHVGDLLINGISVGWHYSYELTNITEDTDVHAVFAVGVSVDELSGEPGLVIYPNPATSKVTIESNNELQEIEVYNISGQLMNRFPTAGSSHSLDVSSFDPGIYMIRVVTRENTQVVRLKVQ